MAGGRKPKPPRPGGHHAAARGRPPTLTPERRGIALHYAAQGWSHKAQARAVGVSWSTFESWLENEPDFSSSLARARLDTSGRPVGSILDLAERAKDENVRLHAAQWWLTVKEPEEFPPPPTPAAGSAGDGGVVVSYDYGAQPPGVPPVKPPESPDDAE